MKYFKNLFILFYVSTHLVGAHATEQTPAPQTETPEVSIEETPKEELKKFDIRQAYRASLVGRAARYTFTDPVTHGPVADNFQDASRKVIRRLPSEYIIFQFINIAIAYGSALFDEGSNPTSVLQQFESYDHPFVSLGSFGVFLFFDEQTKLGLVNIKKSFDYTTGRNLKPGYQENIKKFARGRWLPYVGMGVGLFASSLSHDIFMDQDLMTCSKNFHTYMSEPDSEENPCTKAWNSWITDGKYQTYYPALASMFISTYMSNKLMAVAIPGGTKLVVKGFEYAVGKSSNAKTLRVILEAVGNGVKKVSQYTNQDTFWARNAKKTISMSFMMPPMLLLDRWIAPYTDAAISSHYLAEKVDSAKNLMNETIERSIKDNWEPLPAEGSYVCKNYLIKECVPEAFHAIKHWSHKSKEWKDFLFKSILTSYESWMQKLQEFDGTYSNSYKVLKEYLLLRKDEVQQHKAGKSTLLYDVDYFNGVDEFKPKNSSPTESDLFKETDPAAPIAPILIGPSQLREAKLAKIKTVVDVLKSQNLAADKNEKIRAAINTVIDKLDQTKTRDSKKLAEGLTAFKAGLTQKLCTNCNAEENTAIAYELMKIMQTQDFFPNPPQENSPIGLGFRDYLLNNKALSPYLYANGASHLLLPDTEVQNIDFIFYQFLCGPNPDTKLTKSRLGFKAKFLIPRIINNTYDISEYCKKVDVMDLSSEDSKDVFTTPIKAKNIQTQKIKVYSGLIEFLNENIDSELIAAAGEKTSDKLDSWWASHIDGQVKSAAALLKTEYAKVIKKMVGFVFSDISKMGRGEHFQQFLKDTQAQKKNLSTSYIESAQKDIETLWALLLKLTPEDLKQKHAQSFKDNYNYIIKQISDIRAQLANVNNHFENEKIPLPNKHRINKAEEVFTKYLEDSVMSLVKDFPKDSLKAKAIKEIYTSIFAVHSELVTLLKISIATDFATVIEENKEAMDELEAADTEDELN